MIRRFKIEYDWWTGVVEIDEEKAAADLKECVEFWHGWEKRLDRYNGDYALTFMRYLSPHLISLSEELTREGVQNAMANTEGFCMKLDGSNGIKLISLDEWGIDTDSIDVTEIKPKEVQHDGR